MTDKELKLRLDRARWWSLREQPFYGSLAMGLEDVLCDVKTACTNGKHIRWGKDFLAKLTDEETRFVLLHETMHCAHGHLWRLPMNEKANIACDFAINKVLSAIPGLVMPKGGLLDARWDGLAEEEIYARLPDNPPGGGGKGPGKEGGDIGSTCGDFEEPADDNQGPGKPPPIGQMANSNGDAEGEEPSLQEEWQRRVIQAQQVANAQRGTVPADMQRILERVLATPVDWRKEMADFVRSVISTRNDWSRSARRHAWQPVIYPRKRADDCGLVIFARDTSGSIDNETCALFSAQVSSALAEVGCQGLVIDCDCEIEQEIRLAPGELCPLEAKGGGGTSHVPIWERVAELQEEGESIAGIVCLTDLYSDFPADDGGFASLWLSTTDQTAPFGRTVKIEK